MQRKEAGNFDKAIPACQPYCLLQGYSLSVVECSAGPNHLLVGASQQYESHDGRTRVTKFSDGWIEDYDAVKVCAGLVTTDSSKVSLHTALLLRLARASRPTKQLWKLSSPGDICHCPGSIQINQRSRSAAECA